MEFFRSYFGAIVFAWLGNVAYTFTSHDTLLGFWSRLPVASGLILFTVAHATRRYGMRGMLAYFGEVLKGAALATLLTMVPAGLVAIHRARRILGPYRDGRSYETGTRTASSRPMLLLGESAE